MLYWHTVELTSVPTVAQRGVKPLEFNNNNKKPQNKTAGEKLLFEKMTSVSF